MTETRTLHYRVKKTRVDSLLYAADQDLRDLFDIDGQKSDTMKQFRTIRSNMTDDGDCYRHTVRYTSKAHRPKGRMYSAGKTFADLKPLSRFLLEGYVDCDQVKSNASILIGVGNSKELGTQYLQQYRKGEYKIPKQAFAKICNLDKLPKEFMKYQDIHIEICRINKVLADGLEGHYEYSKQQKNHSPIAHKAQYVREIIERAALECVYPIGIDELIYRYDGVMVHDKHYNMMQFQNSELDYCREVIHSGIEVPDNPDSYLKLKENFELNHFHLGQKVNKINSRKEIIEYSWTSLKENYRPLKCLDPDTGKIRQFIDMWQEDASHRYYEGYSFKPFSIKQPLIETEEDVVLFNRFLGLPYEYEENNSECDWYVEHLNNVFSKEDAAYYLNLQAQRFQYPATKNIVVPMLIGEGGSGKGKLISIDKALYGPKYFFQTQDMSQQFGTFNSTMEDKLLSLSDEVSIANANVYKEEIKNHVGEETILINKKGAVQYVTDNFCSLVFITNNEIVLDSKRRSCYLHHKDTFVGNFEYWDDFTAKVEDKPTMQKVYNFLMEVDLTEFNANRDIPQSMSKVEKEVERYDDGIIWFMEQISDDAKIKVFGRTDDGAYFLECSKFRYDIKNRKIQRFGTCGFNKELVGLRNEKDIFQIKNKRVNGKVTRCLVFSEKGLDKAREKWNDYQLFKSVDEDEPEIVQLGDDSLLYDFEEETNEVDPLDR